jgi:hypothetical protein
MPLPLFQASATWSLFKAATKFLLGLSMSGVLNCAAFSQDLTSGPMLNVGQLDQLLAPIALYPDDLIAPILMASTYPLEIVSASRWLEDPRNNQLQGDALSTALAQNEWDPSVKSLVPYPQIISIMNTKLNWTQALGNAFLAQQADVMDSVQRLRSQAQSAGHLMTTPQQVVSQQGRVIIIEPARLDVIYVPSYDPGIVYGAWAYPDYPPTYFPTWPGYVLAGGFGFGIGLAVLSPYLGWGRFDWRQRHIEIDRSRYGAINRGRGEGPSTWTHDANHRQGVRYGNDAVRARFDAARVNAQRPNQDVRGFDHPVQFGGNTQSIRPQPIHLPQARSDQVSQQPRATQNMGSRNAVGRNDPNVNLRRPIAPNAPISALDGINRGANVRIDAQRGRASRQIAPDPARAAQRQMPSPRAVPAQRAGPIPHPAPGPSANHGQPRARDGAHQRPERP